MPISRTRICCRRCRTSNTRASTPSSTPSPSRAISRRRCCGIASRPRPSCAPRSVALRCRRRPGRRPRPGAGSRAGLRIALRVPQPWPRDHSAFGQRFPRSIAETETAALAQFQQFKSLSDFVDVNRFFQRLHFTSFLTAPREILVMLLTIIMGVLGSVITMTWTFVRRDAGLSVRRFLLLPFVGGMSAFIVLIFLKAGQLTLTAGETTDELSPFVLSFVGIISGLLSERAYGRISEVGQGFFRVDARQDRWGIRLDEALATPACRSRRSPAISILTIWTPPSWSRARRPRDRCSSS